jgi:hypothetical protein
LLDVVDQGAHLTGQIGCRTRDRVVDMHEDFLPDRGLRDFISTVGRRAEEGAVGHDVQGGSAAGGEGDLRAVVALVGLGEASLRARLPGEPAAAPGAGIDTSARVISDALIAVGLDELTDGRRAFVNVSRQLLLDGIPSVLPAEHVVLELASDIEADGEVLAACETLRSKGYSIALSGITRTPETTRPSAGTLGPPREGRIRR